jgi:Protein of unknown function (DUF5661)
LEDEKAAQVEEDDMKTRVLFTIAFILTLACLSMPAIDLNGIFAQYPQEQKVQEKFEHYRQAIKDAFHVDIKDFRDGLNGGLADGKAITEYDLEELLAGMKTEREHTRDNFIALEIAMDHLERIPDYYSRLRRLEREAFSDRLLQM